ncbi:hypothetical protein RM549_04660 [Salegentibacter sp. F188]|uniref:Uncharacterized protein n=1 Tax=Autumnicola patrickiae TaxID=3075591 RepID=A0ABU3DZA7_9FLAO|nr:hypothetical protein [Salegentibacter sp. F188]MDT0689064.1 hypothetical protein [Salegentibacter sp. F188]
MYKALLLIFFFLLSNLYSQDHNEEEVIFLEEVTVNAIRDYKDRVIIKTEGKRNATFSVAEKSIFVSRISNIPEGKISSIKFYFNRRKKTNFTENSFRLKIYHINSELQPGRIINKNDIRFLVTPDHKGEIELDLLNMDLQHLTEIYIGLELLNNNEELGFSLDCITSSDSFSFYKRANSDEWLKIPNIKIRNQLVVVK